MNSAKHKMMIYLLQGKIGHDKYKCIRLNSSSVPQELEPVSYLTLDLDKNNVEKRRISFVNISVDQGTTYEEAVKLLIKSKIKPPNNQGALTPEIVLVVAHHLRQLGYPMAFLGYCRGKSDGSLRAALWYPKELSAKDVLKDFKQVAKAAK